MPQTQASNSRPSLLPAAWNAALLTLGACLHGNPTLLRPVFNLAHSFTAAIAR